MQSPSQSSALINLGLEVVENPKGRSTARRRQGSGDEGVNSARNWYVLPMVEREGQESVRETQKLVSHFLTPNAQEASLLPEPQQGRATTA